MEVEIRNRSIKKIGTGYMFLIPKALVESTNLLAQGRSYTVTLKEEEVPNSGGVLQPGYYSALDSLVNQRGVALC